MDKETLEFVKELIKKHPIKEDQPIFERDYPFSIDSEEVIKEIYGKLEKEAEEKMLSIAQNNEFLKTVSPEKTELLYKFLIMCNKLARSTWAKLQITIDEDHGVCIVDLSSDLLILGMRECMYLWNLCLSTSDITIEGNRSKTKVTFTFELEKPNSNVLERLSCILE